MSLDTIVCADAIEFMRGLPDASVDMVLCDLPYGEIAHKWDVPIDLPLFWKEVARIATRRAAIALTGCQPFTSKAILSNPAWFKYTLVWEKSNGNNFLNTPYQPLCVHEDIMLFSQAASTYSTLGSMSYYPQMERGKHYRAKGGGLKTGLLNYHSPIHEKTVSSDERHPRSVLRFKEEKGLHPTQKPVALFEYLIKTYTLPGETVLDCCVGSGTTAIAARNTGRHFICCDSSPEYVALANKRLADTDPFQSREVAPGVVQHSLFGVLS